MNKIKEVILHQGCYILIDAETLILANTYDNSVDIRVDKIEKRYHIKIVEWLDSKFHKTTKLESNNAQDIIKFIREVLKYAK